MKKCKWCGEEAKHQFKISGEYCCNKYPQQCLEFKKKLSDVKIGRSRSIKSIEKQKESMKGKYSKPQWNNIQENKNILCEYGCKNIAKYQFKNGKFCCSKNYRSCKGIIKNKKEFENNGSKAILLLKNNTSILCSFGCGLIAKYQYKNGKYCCCESFKSCKNIKRKHSNITKEKLSLLNKKEKSYWLKKYPLFSKIEENRYNPDKPNEKEIQVHCKNHNCENSKEKGGWFTPTGTQLYERIRQLESPEGNGGSYFYCSDECKNECPLFNLKSDPFQQQEKLYTAAEYQMFRKKVLERDNYICQYCGELAEHVHHERPQKLEPFHALDPDLAWSVCSKCHYKYGHQDECSTGYLANKTC